MKRLIAVSGIELRQDAQAAKVSALTSDGPVDFEVPVAAFPSIVASVANIALEAWRDQGSPEIPEDQPVTAEIAPSAVKLIHRPDGVPYFLFRVGTMNMAFRFDPDALERQAEALMAGLQTIAATNRARRKPKAP